MANLLTCKTRKSSLFEQGVLNCKLNAALVGCLLATWLLTTGDPRPDPGGPGRLFKVFFSVGLGKPDVVWLVAAVPWVILLVAFEEVKKYLIRRYPNTWIEEHFLW
jgi:hypothetical protein